MLYSSNIALNQGKHRNGSREVYFLEKVCNITYAIRNLKQGPAMTRIFAKKQHGFSMTELSMVLVIISIIIAGALKGRVVIDAAKARSVISEVSQYRTSINSFFSKYGQFPGDFNDATTYWDPPGDTVTADGNGNGQIGFKQDSVYEGYRAWEHLGFARMVEGAFLGSETTGVAELEIDVPKSKTNGGYFIDYDVMGLSEYNMLLLGAPASNSDDASPTDIDGILTPSLAMDIDSKVDDGTPTTGFVRGDDDGDASSSSACVNSTVYDLNDSTKSCMIGFRINRFD